MAKTYQELMAEARDSVPEVTIDEVQAQMENGARPTLLDVREREEYREGHLEGSVPLPRGFLEMRIEEAVPDKGTPIVAYCAGGVRSLIAARTLKEMGYENVTSMSGGYTAWKNAGYKWVADRQFTQSRSRAMHGILPCRKSGSGPGQTARCQSVMRWGGRPRLAGGLIWPRPESAR